MSQSHPAPADHIPLQPVAFEVLASLAGGAAHGYGIIREIEERTGGAFALSTSTLYATLRRLADAGLVEDAGRGPRDDSGGPPRRYYALTDPGREVARLEALRLAEAARVGAERFLDVDRGRSGAEP